MATSGTYNFISTNSQALIDESYERAGYLPDVITAQKIKSWQTSANLTLTSWINQGFNLWTSLRSLINIQENQYAYSLSNLIGIPISDVIDVCLRDFQRPLGGTAFSSNGGNAASVFGGDGPCTQNAINGYISYDYGANQQNEVVMVGVSSHVTRSYTLVYEYSDDAITWVLVGNNSTAVQYTAASGSSNNIIWQEMVKPANARYFRIRETGGAILDIQQIYFTTQISDILMARISGSEWMSYPNKNLSARPTSYWLDRQTSPIINIWPTPTSQYQVLLIRSKKMLQDVGSMTDNIEIPARFYEAFCGAQAYRLAMKKTPIEPERIAMLKAEYQEALDLALLEDVDHDVPLRLVPSFLTGWSR